jgi:hypothetical protein
VMPQGAVFSLELPRGRKTIPRGNICWDAMGTISSSKLPQGGKQFPGETSIVMKWGTVSSP